MYKKILLSIDLHDHTSWRKALPTALEICRASSAELHLITVIPDLPMGIVGMYLSEDTGDRLAQETGRGMAEFVAEHVPGDVGATSHVDVGTVYMAILETAAKIGADLIVIGSHRPEMGDFLLGPNAARVVRHSKVSVLVVRE